MKLFFLMALVVSSFSVQAVADDNANDAPAGYDQAQNSQPQPEAYYTEPPQPQEEQKTQQQQPQQVQQEAVQN